MRPSGIHTTLLGWEDGVERLASLNTRLEFLCLLRDAAELVLEGRRRARSVQCRHHVILGIGDGGDVEGHHQNRRTVGGHRLDAGGLQGLARWYLLGYPAGIHNGKVHRAVGDTYFVGVGLGWHCCWTCSWYNDKSGWEMAREDM